MCGIFGYHNGRNALTNREEHLVINTINHRGPDDKGFYNHENLFLGHTRLSILDTTENGHQPMHSADGNFAIIYNGELYNHVEIRRDLERRGYNFRSRSDTETLLYAYIEYGTPVLKILNGIFSFSIYDKKAQKLFIVRDQLGVKPLYYYLDGGTFCFGSEIKSISEIPNFDSSLDYSSFAYYLQMLYAPKDITPFKHVRKLEPGHFIEYDLKSQRLCVTKYFNIDFSIRTDLSEQGWIDEVDTILNAAVQRQLQSDVPVGFFLSGGIDSSLISAYVSKEQATETLTAFTVSSNEAFYKEGFEEDEQYAKLVADHLGIKLEKVRADLSIVDDFDLMIRHLDEPQADPAPLLVYNISKSARAAGIKVLLSGAGADDIFSGYRRHQALNYERIFNVLPNSFFRAVKTIADPFLGASPSMRRLRKMLESAGASQYQRWSSYFSWLPQSEVYGLFNEEVKEILRKSVTPQEYWVSLFNELPASTGSLNKMIYAEMKTFLPDHNLNYVDKMSMAQGVETRVPFLDMDVVRLANSMPLKYKMKGNTTKYIIRQIGSKYLPQDIMSRRKTGFGAPVRHWIKNDMKDMVYERLQNPMLDEVFDRNAIFRLVEKNMDDKIDASYSIWALLAIESWIRQFKFPVEKPSENITNNYKSV